MGKRSSSIFGHKSLESVFQPLVDQVCTKYSVIVRQLGQDRSEEVQFHCFLNNSKVRPKRLVDFHWQECSITAFNDRHLLVISDTSTISFTADSRREYLGYLPHQGKKRWLYPSSGHSYRCLRWRVLRSRRYSFSSD